jgi:hypothetical protein
MSMRRVLRVVVLGSAGLVGAVSPSCTCQRQENIEAKERLSKPAPPDPHVKAADEKINVDNLTDAAVMSRVARMEGQEIAARLGSFSMTSEANLSFGRGPVDGGSKVRSGEKTRMVQSSNGDFAVELTTGDGSEMKLAYVNEIFFLKNNNGQWRMSRDPGGERNQYRSDALGVWRSFYDLVKHGLVVERIGPGTQGSRGVVKYKLTLPDQSAEAKAAGAQIPQPEAKVGPDGGPVDEPAGEKLKRMRDRLASWRERAKPAGGGGELWVDESTAVVTMVKFQGAMVVGDGPEPARLDVKIDMNVDNIGKDQVVPMPKDAIEDVLRKKMPVHPREILEQEGVVAPLADAGPAGSRATKPPPPKGDIPDDEEAP